MSLIIVLLLLTQTIKNKRFFVVYSTIKLVTILQSFLSSTVYFIALTLLNSESPNMLGIGRWSTVLVTTTAT
jgi:hypothetical protein